MHIIQIYLEELKRQANTLGISLSGYIRETLKKDMEEKKKKPSSVDLSNFSGIWEGREITQESLRKKAWKR